jgi:hypothetical protein
MSATVMSKRSVDDTFGNDACFIRVRHRKLKGGGGDPGWREYMIEQGERALVSASYDVVRAVRIDGKPRQKFLCGLGSIKQDKRHNALSWWRGAICRMMRAGFNPEQRRRIIIQAAAKGVPLPSRDDCLKYAEQAASLPYQMPVEAARELANVVSKWEVDDAFGNDGRRV